MSLDLLSFRDLEGSTPRTPLRRFKGKLAKIEDKEVPTQNRTYLQVIFHFTNVEVIESIEPYDLPTAEIVFSYSRRATSKWGILSHSAAKFLDTIYPDGVFNEEKQTQIPADVPQLEGLELEMAMVSHKLWDGRAKQETDQLCWEVADAEAAPIGEQQVTTAELAMQMLDGKTAQQFRSQAIKDPVLRSDAAIQGSIIGGTFEASLVTGGLFSKDKDGVYHKV